MRPPHAEQDLTAVPYVPWPRFPSRGAAEVEHDISDDLCDLRQTTGIVHELRIDGRGAEQGEEDSY